MAFFEDSDPRPLGAEVQLLSGVSYPSTNRLLKRLLVDQLTEKVPHAMARMITVLATAAEPGSVFVGLFQPRFLDVEFRSKQNVLDIDTALQPYYGNVRPALAELQAAGVDRAVTAFWLDYFRKDNAIYRVYVVNAMCLSGALRELS